MAPSKSPSSKPFSFYVLLVTTLVFYLLCTSPASALAVPKAPGRAKSLAPPRDTATIDTASLPIAVPGSKNLPFQLPPCEDEAACAEALWRAGSRVNAHAEEEAPAHDAAHNVSGGSSHGPNRSKNGGANKNAALTEQLSGKRRPFEAPEWSRIF